MHEKSHFIDMPQGHRLHIKEFSPESGRSKKQPLLFIHGAIEDGRIFYSKKGKGLAPFLSEQGFSCFVVDLRARGESTPPLKEAKDFNQHNLLDEDFPALLNFMRETTGQDHFSFVTHSWGGVLVNSFLLKSPQWIPYCLRNVHVSSKRRVGVLNLQRFFYIDLMWLIVGKIILLLKGYLPPRWYGPAGESGGTLRDSQKWVYSYSWLDKKNGLDYNYLADQHSLPPTFYLTGAADKCLGHYKDVKRFALESRHPLKNVFLIGKEKGNKQDYDHINILTHPEAREDHFKIIRDYLETGSLADRQAGSL
jgi:predicted alpha/beta hydrolase